jgi:tRNA 2-thiouridine synthesizing protein C
MDNKKRVLIINQSPPYSTSKARESLDVALTCSIFEMPVSLAFIGDGVLQLLKGQDPSCLNMKKHEAMLTALPMYDIENIFVTQSALNSNGLSIEDLAISVKVIADKGLSDLIQQHDAVLTF